MGHAVYYTTKVDKWEEFKRFLKKVCEGLGFRLVERKEAVIIFPECYGVEPLEIKKRGYGFVKTNLVEPCHSMYLLILYSVSSFGSIELWED